MKNIKKLFIATTILGTMSYNANAQNVKDYLDRTPQKTSREFEKPKYYLGFNLMPNQNNLISYALIKVFEKDTTVKFITKKNFLLQATGKQTSKANPGLENLMEKNGIQNCTDDCPVLDKLWKLSYWRHPYKIKSKPITVFKPDTIGWTTDTIGWTEPDTLGWSCSNNFPYNHPSKFQLNTLGIKRPSDFIYGNNAFEILKSMQDKSWVSWYKTLWGENQ